MRNLALTLSIGLLLALTACGNSSDSTSSSSKPKVLTTFTVIADMARQVGGDRVDVASITKVGAEIHGYEPTPSDLVRASKADLVLENGLNLERWFKQFIQRSKAPSVTITEGIETMPIAGGGEYGGKPNPHAWVSFKNAKTYVRNIEAALIKLDPAGQQTFTANANRYISQIDQVAKKAKSDLDRLPKNQRALVTCEGAFSYLARDFGLSESYLWPVNADQQGTPKQIAKVINFVKKNHVPAVFCESTVSNKPQRQVANETGATLGDTLYVDSLSKADGPVPSYLTLLQRNIESITSALTIGSK